MSVKLLKQSAVSNPNLLINGDFQVWQRGTSFNYNVSNKYCADRWLLIHGAYYNAMMIDKHNKGMQVTLTTSSGSGGGMYQYVDNVVYGKTYTFSVSVNDTVYILTGTPLSDGVEISKSFTDFKITIKWDNANKCIRVGVWFNTINKTYIVNWTKLEYGALNTMFVPRLSADEIMACGRYARTETVTGILYRQESGYNYYRLITNNRFRVIPSTHWISADIPYVGDVPIYSSTAINEKGEGVILITTAKAGTSTIVNVTVQYDAEIYPS